MRFICCSLGLVLASAAHAQVQINPLNGHGYELIVPGGGLSWSTANSAAESRVYHNTNGHLATIASASEQAFLSNKFNGQLAGIWLGGIQDHGAPGYSEPAGGWTWVTGEAWGYTNWNFSEPNDTHGYHGQDPALGEDALQMSTGSGGWNDIVGSAAFADVCRGYLVEYELPLLPIVNPGNGHGYLRIDHESGVTWDAANVEAMSMVISGRRGHLVTITSQSEQNFLIDTFGPGAGLDLRGVWYGGYQVSGPEPIGIWAWVTGEAWDYTNWNPGEPNDSRSYRNVNQDEDRLIGWNSAGGWNDLANLFPFADDAHGFIVEFEGTECVGDLNGDGLVEDSDFSLFAQQYNVLVCTDPGMPSGCSADLNQDGFVDDQDFLIFVQAYNELLCP
ncbi:MAG: lectin-like protein [Phycisphaerales bacterium]